MSILRTALLDQLMAKPLLNIESNGWHHSRPVGGRMVRATNWCRWLAVLLIGFAVPQAVSAEKSPVTAHRLIVGWDDAVICCGPGTDAGMDSPQAVERIVKRWKARGYQGVYWRVDEAMLPDRFMTRWKPKVSPSQNYLLERVDQTLRKFPLIKTLLGLLGVVWVNFRLFELGSKLEQAGGRAASLIARAPLRSQVRLISVLFPLVS